MTQTLWAAIPALAPDIDEFKLDPRRVYLRVSILGRTALMVLGYRDPSPEGEIDTWYSGKGETIRLQNGRIVATAGLETDWRAVRYRSLPAWSDMPASAAVEYGRERDEMPGYRFGIRERVLLQRIAAPSDSKMVGLEPGAFQWFAERIVGQSDDVRSARFAVEYANGSSRVVYGEQCLTATLCLAWQSWPVAR